MKKFRIALINMPFAALELPSLALTQLAAVLEESLGAAVGVKTHYFNLDLVSYLGDRRFYDHAIQDTGFMTGIGDWFFRGVAFPEAEDNADEYFGRFYFEQDDQTRMLRRIFGEKRFGLTEFIDALIEKYDLASADMVGFTTLFAQTVASIAMARRLKKVNPEIITVIGGAACEGKMGEEFARQVPWADHFFTGPALASFPAFAGNCMTGGGASFGRAVTGDDRDINALLDLDYGPFLDQYESVFGQSESKPVLLFETSRGCYWAKRSPCTFCGLTGQRKTYSQMEPEKALAHIQSLGRWFPRSTSCIAVDTVLPRGYAKDIFPRLRLPDGLKLMYEVRPELEENELKSLCEAGVAAIQPGIESLSTPTLKLMRKGTTAFRNIAFLKACSRYPVTLDWNLLVFSPGEPESTLEKYLRDIPLLTHLPPPRGVFPVNFVRHSEYFRHPELYGLDLRPQDFYRLTYPFPDVAIANIAEHFVDRNAGVERIEHWLDLLNEQVCRWKERWTGTDGKPQARLCLLGEEGHRSVYDSRGGEEIEYEIGPETERVLDLLGRPASIETIRRELADAAAVDIPAEIAFINERGLAFEEGGWYLALV